MLKSELTNEEIKPKKLITTKKNCKNVKDNILLSNLYEFLKFLIEKKIIRKEQLSPNNKELNPIVLAKIISPSEPLLLLVACNFHHVLLKFL